MKLAPMKIVRGGLFAGVIGLAGCAYRVHAPGITVTNEPEPVPAAYAYADYDPVYYDAGWYAGPNWYWYGPGHRLFHEDRGWHERHYYGHYHRHWR